MKNILSTILLLLATVQLFADDGGVRDYNSWTYGNIYVKEPNDKIALKKELMEVDKDKDLLKATFVFENTTDEDVVVDCAFPIVIGLNFNVTEDGFIESENFNADDSYLWKMLIGKGLRDSHYEHQVPYEEAMQILDEKLTKMTFSEFEKLGRGLGCDIEQDGQTVLIENVGIETSLESALVVTLHFHHKLKFPKKKESLVVVSHSINSLSYAQGNDPIKYDFHYDISTGGTWKGPIESFIVKTEFEMSGDFSKVRTGVEGWLYFKKDYKPRKEESLDFSLIKDAFIMKFPKKRERENILEIIAASEDVKNLQHLTDCDILTNISTEDWENSWIDFTLKDYALGPFIVNGRCENTLNELWANWFFNDFGYDGEHDIVYDDEDILFCEFGDSVWSNSSRVKTLSIESKDTSEQWNFSLRDGYAALISEREWNGANSVGNVRLFSPGRYRMKLKDIYKGDKGSTTGLSEMWFYSAGTNVPHLYEMISKDKADKHQIFHNVLTISQWRGLRGYDGELYSQTDSLYIVLDSVFKSYPNGTIPDRTIPEGEVVTAELFAILKKYRGDTRFSKIDYSTFVYGKEVAPDTLSADTTKTYEEQKEVVKKEEPVAEKQAEASVSDTQKTGVFAALLVYASFVLIVCVVWAIRRRKQGRG